MARKIPGMTCAAATICAEPGRCSAAVSPLELVMLLVLVLLPIAVSSYPSQLIRCRGMASRFESETVGCGPCLAPRICAVSGLLAVLALLVLGFVPTFFLFLLSRNPCDTALGACGSISCACGNFLPQGYVWMFGTLFLASLLLMKEFASMPGNRSSRARQLKCVLSLAALLLCLTATYPEHFSLDPSGTIFFFAFGYALHFAGLGTACLVLVGLPFCCIVCASRGAPGRRSALLVRSAHLLLAVVYAGTFGVVKGHADVSDYVRRGRELNPRHRSRTWSSGPLRPPPCRGAQCAPITTAAACEAWPPAGVCGSLHRLHGATGHRLPTSYTCAYDNASLSVVEELLYPPEFVAAHRGRCRKGSCALYANARSIALEFGVLFLVATYVIGFGLGDMKWVLGQIVADSPMEAAEAAMLVGPDGERRPAPLVGEAPVNA